MVQNTQVDNINVNSLLDFFTDPGFAVIAGFVVLFLPFIVSLLNPTGMAPIMHDAYTLYAGGVVGLVTAHAWKDADKTKYLAEIQSNNSGLPPPQTP